MKNQIIQSLQLILNPHDLYINDLSSGLDQNKFIGHGFPRTIEQLDLLINLAQHYKIAITFVNLKSDAYSKNRKSQFKISLKYLTSNDEHKVTDDNFEINESVKFAAVYQLFKNGQHVA